MPSLTDQYVLKSKVSTQLASLGIAGSAAGTDPKEPHSKYVWLINLGQANVAYEFMDLTETLKP
jgi:hypothetical protein